MMCKEKCNFYDNEAEYCEVSKFARCNNISFETAAGVLSGHYEKQDKDMQEVYESIIKGMR